MNKSKIIAGLERICSTSKKSQKKPEEFESYSWWNKEGISVLLSGEEYKEFQKIINIIFSSVEIKNNFQRKDIENSLKELISRILKNKSEDVRKKKIKKEVNNFVKGLQGDINDWIFLIPIENLYLDKHSINVGNIVFQRMTKNKITKLQEKNKKIILSVKNLGEKAKKDFADNEKKRMENFFLGKTCARVESSGTFSTAKYIAMQKTNAILSILKLFTGSSETYSSKKYFGIEGEIISIKNRMIYGFRKDWQNATPSYEKVGYLFDFDLSKERRKIMNSNGFRKIMNIYNKNEWNDLDERIFNAVYWFSKAYDIPIVKKDKIEGRGQLESNQFNFSDKFLKLMIVLESLLIFGRESKTRNIKNRGSYLLEGDPTKRASIKKQLGYLYELRSDIVHEGSIKLSIKDIKLLNLYAQSIIISLIKNKAKWKLNTKRDLYIWFEKQRLDEEKLR